jgi:hypothetical protein
MSDLRLNHTQEALVARLAAVSGRDQADIIDEALAAFAREREEHDQWVASQMPALAAAWDNDDDAIYDRL